MDFPKSQAAFLDIFKTRCIELKTDPWFLDLTTNELVAVGRLMAVYALLILRMSLLPYRSSLLSKLAKMYASLPKMINFLYLSFD